MKKLTLFLASTLLTQTIAVTASHAGTHTCPPLTATGVCKSGQWQINANNKHSQWTLWHKLHGTPCNEEGRIIKQLAWTAAYSSTGNQDILCHYYFTEFPFAFMHYDLTLYSPHYNVDQKNPHWGFSDMWRWRCALPTDTVNDCTLLVA